MDIFASLDTAGGPRDPGGWGCQSNGVKPKSANPVTVVMEIVPLPTTLHTKIGVAHTLGLGC